MLAASCRAATPFPVPAEVLNFSAVSTRYWQFQITANNGSQTTTGFEEIVFRQVDQVPRGRCV